MEPLVTIVLPVRNGQRHVRRAVASVLSQTLRELRLFVSDNDSTDNTVSILEEYSHRDSRVTVRRQARDIGVIQNLAFCLANVTTPFVSFLAHDDYFAADNALELALEILQRNPDIAAVYGDMLYVGDDGQTLAVRRYDRSGAIRTDTLLRRSIITTRNMFGIPVLMRTALLQSVTPDQRLTYVVDVDLCYASAAGRYVYHVPDVLLANRFHPGNASWHLLTQAQAQFRLIAEKYGVILSSRERLENLFFSRFVIFEKLLFLGWLKLESTARTTLRTLRRDPPPTRP